MSVLLAVGDTQQLTATVFDTLDNLLTGRTVTWSSSDPTIATVNASGLVTAIGAGDCTISAMCDGKAGTDAISVFALLVPSLDWAPLVRRADLTQPLTFTPYVDLVNGAGSGYQQYLLKQQGTNTLGVSRAMFPKSATEWGGYAQIDALMAASFSPNFNDTHVQLAGQGPYDNTTAWSVDGTLATGSPTVINPIWKDPGTMDSQDISTWKRGIGVAVKAKTAGDIGKSVRMGFASNAALAGNPPWGSITFLKTPTTTVLTSDWSFVYLEFDNYAQFSGVGASNMNLAIGIAQDSTSYIFAAFTSWDWHAHETDDPSNWGRPLPWHETLGLAAQFQTQNSWAPDSDLPVLYGGASRASTVVAAPDSNRYYGGRTLSEYTLPADNDGITTSGAFRCERASDFYPTGDPTGAVWLHWYLEAGAGALPADGALKGYVVGSRTGTTYGPVSLSRDGTGPLSRFYRCRIPVNQFTTKYWKLDSGSQVGGNYRFVTLGSHNLLVADLITISGCSVPALNGQWTIAAIPGGASFEITTTAASSTGGAVATGDLDFTPRIVNASGGQLKFNAYRAAMTAENPRSYGYHHCLVPKRTVTAPVYNDSAFVILPKSVPNLSVEEGIWIFRHVPIFGLTDILNLNGNASDFDQLDYLSPGLWQSGPLGSADASFACDINRSTTPGCIDLLISVARGSPFNTGDWVRWSANITAIPASSTTFPRLVAFDIALAWKNHAVVAFGIGNGTGTSITWLNNGDTFLGGTVAISSGNGTAWDLDVVSNDSHMGIGGDRDVIRQTGGFTQAILTAGAGSVVSATVKGSIEAHIASRLGARQDYR